MDKINVTELSPARLKAELEMRGHTFSSVGRKIGIHRTDVSMCVHHWREIFSAIDELINSEAA
jgi:lambda repressor-like predicted transcriptional regulator